MLSKLPEKPFSPRSNKLFQIPNKDNTTKIPLFPTTVKLFFLFQHFNFILLSNCKSNYSFNVKSTEGPNNKINVKNIKKS